MSVLNAILIGLATGMVFGFALEKSRVFEPGVIVGQMQLRNFLMLKIFLAAVITGLIFILLGGVAGALTYGYFDAPITAFFAEKGDKVGFDQLLGLPFWMAAIASALLLAALLWSLESWQSWHAETGADGDGLMQPRSNHTAPTNAHLTRT